MRAHPPQAGPDTDDRRIFLDGHVHIYRDFDTCGLLGYAAQRARTLGGPLLLMLTETSDCDAFAELRNEGLGGSACTAAGPPLEPQRTSEPESLAVREVGMDEASVFVVAGRQWVTSEGLELLALGQTAKRPDPTPSRPSASELARELLDAGLPVVVPWGVGKWIGHRGRVARDLLRRSALSDHPLLFGGDISHRCWPWPAPEAFGGPTRVLCGTDLLPLPGLECHVADYGTSLVLSFDQNRPFDSLRAALRSRVPLTSFGKRASPVRVVREQLAYRRRK